MTQEEKQLLLIDLCGRLPYGVKCQIDTGDNDVYVDTLATITIDGCACFLETIDTEDILEYGDIKPLLFPMSSMTKEQKIMIRALQDMGMSYYHLIIDHYNEWHLDYRDLIPKGLAEDATGISKAIADNAAAIALNKAAIESNDGDIEAIQNEITTAATQTTFWQGETFNYDDLVVTAHYSDAEDEIITPTVTGSTATAGPATVNVSYKEQSTSYTITVKAIPNTKETAYTVADAYDIIDKLTTAEGVFISGTISQIDSYSDQYKSITYWISADGTTTKQLQVYSGKGLESADFAAVTDLSVGDQVIVCGNLKKYSGTYEFDKNNYLVSHTPTTKDPAGLAYATTSYTANVGEPFTTPELTNPHNLVVTYATSDASKATVDANSGAVTIVAAGVVTITAATTGDATHDAGSASYTITISNPAMAVATLPFTFIITSIVSQSSTFWYVYVIKNSSHPATL